jgi:uncharacterized SAM-binding protein YcdF (DUF218 family)
MKNRNKIALGGCSILVILVVIAGIFLIFAGVLLVRKDPLKNSEALVILSGGGEERLEAGANLYHDGKVRRIILTETDELQTGSSTPITTINYEALASRYGIDKSKLYKTKKTSSSTYEEAQAVLLLMKQKDWKSLVIVTDNFHSRRTGMIFDKIFKSSGIKVSVQPVNVQGYWYDPIKWWKDSESRDVTVLEYVKIFYFLSGQYEK